MHAHHDLQADPRGVAEVVVNGDDDVGGWRALHAAVLDVDAAAAGAWLGYLHAAQSHMSRCCNLRSAFMAHWLYEVAEQSSVAETIIS